MTPARQRPHRRLALIIFVVILALILAVILYAVLAPPPPTVEVNYMVDWAPDGVCGLNSSVYYDGFNASTGSSESFELQVPNVNATSCTITNVVTNTSGFSLSQVQVPLTIPGNTTYVELNLTINNPNVGFNGNLNLVFS